MTLGQLIRALKAEAPDRVLIWGLSNYDADRGNFSGVAGKIKGGVLVRDMLRETEKAIGSTFFRKGGEYKMDVNSHVYAVGEDDNGVVLGRQLLKVMLSQSFSLEWARAAIDDDRTALLDHWETRERVIGAIRDGLEEHAQDLFSAKKDEAAFYVRDTLPHELSWFSAQTTPPEPDEVFWERGVASVLAALGKALETT